MKSPIRPTILAVVISSILAVVSSYAQTYSQARAVRLSFVEGQVTVQRPDAQGWAEAPVNTPLQEGFKLATGENSYAEVQFENGGTIRLGQFSTLQFTQLELAPNGAKVDRVDLRRGYATLHPLPSRDEESLELTTPLGRLNAPAGTEFRVDLDQGNERVEVFAGAVQVESNLGDITIDKDSVLLMQPGTSEPTVVSQGIAKDDWDQWVDDREAQLGQAAGPPASEEGGDATEVVYGWNDLSNYGNWSDVPGVGYGWSPGGVGSGWAPYTAGQWCWYPGWGYTWIGAEPWGWLPYHYGGWNFIPGRGWVWFPGGFTNWSPSRVVWYSGPNWVGWRPRPYRKDDSLACGMHCGGGVVSTNTFQQGGRLSSSLMLGVNPATGQRIGEPGVTPLASALLPGRPVARPPMAGQSRAAHRISAPHGPAQSATTQPSVAPQRHGASMTGSSIVYDPAENRYVNSHRPTNPQEPAATSPAASGFTTPGARPALVQPVPVTGRQANGMNAPNQPWNQPNPAMGGGPRPTPATGNYPYASRPSPSTTGRSSSPPAGNGYAGRPAGSGGSAGAVHSGGGSFSSGGGGGHAAAPSGGGGGGGGGHH